MHEIRAHRPIYYPIFDRSRDIAIAGAGFIPEDCRLVIIEGNYLMFDETPWNVLASLWDLSIRLDAPMPVLRERLVNRWLSFGYSRCDAISRAESNDIPNAQRVIERALACDINIESV